MELICLSRERWESRVTPRILIWSDKETEPIGAYDHFVVEMYSPNGVFVYKRTSN